MDREERLRRRRELYRLACPKYPESKDRVPKSFSFIPRACVFRLAPRCCLHLSSNKLSNSLGLGQMFEGSEASELGFATFYPSLHTYNI